MFNLLNNIKCQTYYKYTSFGSVLQGRSWVESGVSKYRFGMNGQEKEDDVAGADNIYSAEYWMYDSRLGRRFEMDPLNIDYPWQSPYCVFNNNPIIYTDFLGLEGSKTSDGMEGGNLNKNSTNPKVNLSTIINEGLNRLKTLYAKYKSKHGVHICDRHCEQSTSERSGQHHNYVENNGKTFEIRVIIHHGSYIYDGDAGGQLGGHVMINFGNNDVYGFTGWGVKDKNGNNLLERNEYKKIPLISSKDPLTGEYYSEIHGNEHYGDYGILSSGYIINDNQLKPCGMTSVFIIKVTSAEFDDIKKWYEFYNQSTKPPYAYTQFGMRCASSVYSKLKDKNVLNSFTNLIPFNSFSNAFGPGFLFRYLRRQGYFYSTYINFNGMTLKDKKKTNSYGISK